MANIRPLEGKYYGTIVELDDSKTITVWVMDNYNWATPSPRQLEQWSVSLEEAKADDMMSDSHFESARGYNIACAIESALNEIGE